MLPLTILRESIKTAAGRDAELTALRDAVEAQFEQLTAFLYAERAGYVEVIENPMRGDSRDVIWLNLSPVTTLTLVEEKARASGAVWTALASTAYELVGTRRLTKLSGNFDDHVRVTYTGGYSDSTCPRDVKGALLAQVKLLWQRLDEQKIAISAQGFEAGSTTFLPPDMHPLFAQAVARYKRKF